MNKFHKNLTADKWSRYSKKDQILMIASEFGRAKSWINKKKFEEVQNCYLRALELLVMTIEDPKWKSGLKELSRFKELLGEAYSVKFADLPFCLSLYRVLLSWNGDTAKVYP